MQQITDQNKTTLSGQRSHQTEKGWKNPKIVSKINIIQGSRTKSTAVFCDRAQQTWDRQKSKR